MAWAHKCATTLFKYYHSALHMFGICMLLLLDKLSLCLTKDPIFDGVTQAQHAARSEASFSAWQLQDATASTSYAVPARSVPSTTSSSSLSSSSSSLAALPRGGVSSSQSHIAANQVDTLLTGSSPATETCSRRNSKAPLLPRTKSTYGRHTRQQTPCLRPSFSGLAHTSGSAHTPDAAGASDAHTHGYHPLQDVEGQPCGGVWQKLGSSLSAVWRWLCMSGSKLLMVGRKLREKLLAALGLGQEEAQRLLAQQQAEELEALTIRPDMPMQPVQPHGPHEPRSHSTLQRWRL